MTYLGLAVCLGTFPLLWGVFFRLHSDWRRSFLSAAITWAVTLVAITELLSAVRALTFPALVTAWSTCFVAAALLWLRFVGDPRPIFRQARFGQRSTVEWLLLAGSGLVALILAVIAWFAPPNTYDALTYHMPRVMHWMQDESLAFFPTHILRQLYLNPGAEFIILHLTVLAGSDRLAPFVQWSGMVGSAIGISLIARDLGAGPRGQLFSALAAITLPMGILQATGTQNDYVAGLWLVAFSSSMISFKSRGSWWSAAASGASLGLALLTKSTAYIFALPLLVWLSIAALRSHRSKAVTPLAVAAMLVVLINLGTYVRDLELFGNPFGITREPSIQTAYSNDAFSAAALASNVLRNTALHLQTPSVRLNAELTQFVIRLHSYVGISADDPRTTWPGTQFDIPPIEYSENGDGNPIHLGLFLIVSIAVGTQPDLRKRLLGYMLCLLAAYLLFCLYLKWQPWNSRLHLPLFLMAAPLIGSAVEVFRPSWIAHALLTLLLVVSLPWVFLNRARPLIGSLSVLDQDRTTLYFNYDKATMRDYANAVKFLAKAVGSECSPIGLYIGGNDMEYPFWLLVHGSFSHDVKLEAVGVDNLSAKEYANFPEEPPCGVLSLRGVEAGALQVAGKAYASARVFGIVDVLLPSK